MAALLPRLFRLRQGLSSSIFLVQLLMIILQFHHAKYLPYFRPKCYPKEQTGTSSPGRYSSLTHDIEIQESQEIACSGNGAMQPQWWGKPATIPGASGSVACALCDGRQEACERGKDELKEDSTESALETQGMRFIWGKPEGLGMSWWPPSKQDSEAPYFFGN